MFTIMTKLMTLKITLNLFQMRTMMMMMMTTMIWLIAEIQTPVPVPPHSQLLHQHPQLPQITHKKN